MIGGLIRRWPSAAVFGLLTGAMASLPAPSHAQSIRDTVRQHVSEGLEERPPDSKPDPKKRR